MDTRLRRHVHRYIRFLAGVVIVLVLLGAVSGLIVDWLWFGELGYRGIFLRILELKLLPAALAGVGAFLFLGINLGLARGRTMVEESRGLRERFENLLGGNGRFSSLVIRRGHWLAAAVAAIPFALSVGGSWETILRWFWSGSVGRTDPIFGQDLGFYLFELPFLELIQNTLSSLAFLALVALLALLLSATIPRRRGEGFTRPGRPALLHLAFIFLLYMAGVAWGYWLDRYGLLFSTHGAVHGAGFTDVTIRLRSLWLMTAASAGLGVLVLLCSLRDRLRPVLWVAGGFLLLHGIAILLAPRLVQNFVVEPNELELETPFLKYEIASTREAYGIDRLEIRDYPALADLTAEKVFENGQTLRNVRLWDWRPLLQTFRQLQEIRSYYRFYEVDVDRYLLDGEYRQVMLSARELSPNLPGRADTWVNRTLQFTHGYGLVMCPVAQEGEEGTPSLLVRDLPPKVSGGLELTEPAVFFGEKTPGYRIVNTGVRELDYPRGDDNVYTSYAGHGGIGLDSFWKKVLFAWEFRDINILISDYLRDDSLLQIRRTVRERTETAAPFLQYDNDPYLVMADGRLYWIRDAYTTSDRYPYSDPREGGLNYIRNSVKAVVDVYEGTVRFYATRQDEPVLEVYQRAFPGVFRPLEEMPEELRRHIRYPEDLFRIQVDTFNRYHMTVPQVFYNNEDLWTLPNEKYAGNPIPMDPYYILMRLPGEKRLEFLLMLPLTPKGRDNMIAWMAARCDAPDYGRLLVYKLSKEKLIFGPMQVEALIDQDPDISRQLSLWDQRGSQVIRGNLLVIPLDNSFIYVEPVYLTAEGNNIPQLRRVIVAYNERVAMEPTLEKAVSAVFGRPPGKAAGERKEEAVPVSSARLEEVRKSFDKAQKALQEGNWGDFGKYMGEVRELLHKGD